MLTYKKVWFIFSCKKKYNLDLKYRIFTVFMKNILLLLLLNYNILINTTQQLLYLIYKK